MLGVAFVTLGALTPANAEKRAFLVGIADYTHISKLVTPGADVAAVSKTLLRIGFKTEILSDPDRMEFDEKWNAFLGSLQPGDTAIFYFAGHGLQVEGTNYLLPKDTPALDAGEAAILGKAVSFIQLTDDLDARRLAATIYILDACRNNPFVLAGAAKARSALGQARGLAGMERLYGAFVMYSAGVNELALDAIAGGKNSVYVTRLLPLLASTELSLVEIAKRVQVGVDEDARGVKHTQRPAYIDGILGQYFLKDEKSPNRTLGPAERIPGENFIRLAAFATWDANCRNRPAPRVSATAALKYGRIVNRFESFSVGGTHFGNSCDKSTQRGIGVYYLIDDAHLESNAVETVRLNVQHWSIAPPTTVAESFDVDLATRHNRRTTKR